MAVVLPARTVPAEVNDSKALRPHVRERLAHELRQLPGIQIGIAEVCPADIDRINIRQATHAGMRAALLQLDPAPDFVLVDGLPVTGLPVSQSQSLIKGDARSASIAAASILAKVHRDRYMVALDDRFPGYGFAQHKGYGTAEHLKILKTVGPSAFHRFSFRPIRIDE